MVKIRLRRMGAHKKPFYRIIVAAGNGRFIEELGYFNPMVEPNDIKVDAEKAKEWLSKGAQPTERVRSIFKKTGVIE